MDEKQMHMAMMVAGGVLAAICGLGAAGVLIFMTSLLQLIPAAVLVAFAIGSAWGATYYGRQLSSDSKAFTEAEQAVLFPKQRHDLRKARADVLLQKALTEVEEERDKLLTRQLEASKPKDEREPEVKVHRPTPIQPVPHWQEQPGHGR